MARRVTRLGAVLGAVSRTGSAEWAGGHKTWADVVGVRMRRREPTEGDTGSDHRCAGARARGGDGGGTGSLLRSGDALRRAEGQVKIRNQDVDFRNSRLRWKGTGNSRLRWKGTGKEATQPMRKRRRSPPPKQPCPEAPMRPCPAARGGSGHKNRNQIT